MRNTPLRKGRLRRRIALLLPIAIFMGLFQGLVLNPQMANAAIILTMADTDGLKYDHATAKNIVGTGTANGDIVLYPNVGSFGGYAIDGVVTTGAISGSIDNYDNPGSASSVTGSNNYFMINTTGGSATLTFTYYVAGTYTGPNTGIPVTLQNVKINSIDIDSSQATGSYQYSDFTSFQNYSLTSDTNLRVIPMTGPTRVRFQAGLAGNRNSVPQDQVLVKYTTVNSLTVTFGNVVAAQMNYFGLIFGPWSNTGTPVEYGNLYATVPTSSSTTLNVPETLTANTTFPINIGSFGNYQDAGGNAFSQVQITGITPTTAGTLKYNGANITANQNITVADINNGLITWVPAGNSNTTPVVVTFYVNNGVYNSANTYTLTLNPVGSSQSINFNTPSSKTVGTVFNSAANATSLLPVTVTSSTTGVCTVSSADSLTVTAVAVGTCVLTAVQPGNASYSAATPVTVQFQVVSATATSQTITFANPGSQTTGATITTSPTASSGLTVTLASLTPAICSVSGFVITTISAGSCQIQATQSGNATYSAATPVINSFTVSAPASGSIAPVVRTTMAGVCYGSSNNSTFSGCSTSGSSSSIGAVLSGRVDRNNQSVNYRFSYSTCGSLSSDTYTTGQSCSVTYLPSSSGSAVGSSPTSDFPETATTTSTLSSGKTYYYRIEALPSGSSTWIYGHLFVFKTPGSSWNGNGNGNSGSSTPTSATYPVITTNPATTATTTSATLNGTLGRTIPANIVSNNNNNYTYFKYYETTTVSYCLGLDQIMVPSTGKKTNCDVSLNGSTVYDTATGTSSSAKVIKLDSVTATGLTANTTYYYQAIVTYNRLAVKLSDSSTSTSSNVTYGNLVSFNTAQAPPTVVTIPATNIKTTTATLNGSVSNFGTATTLYFYKSDTQTTTGGKLNSSIYETATPSTTSANGPISFTYALTGLTSGNTYYFQAVASAGGTIVYGPVLSFKTGAPSAQTMSASDLTSPGWSVVLNGYTITNGVPNVRQNFCHIANSYTLGAGGAITGCTVDTATVQTVNSNSPDSVTVTGLSSGTTYYFQAIATNVDTPTLVSYGQVLSFTTVLPPVVTSVDATLVTSNSATINGTINPNGASTSGWFCLSDVSTVDDAGVLQSCLISPTSTPGTVSTTSNTSTNLSNLQAGKTYYFQAVGQNSSGTSYGIVKSFSTGILPLVTATAATSIGSSSATLNGTASAAGGADATVTFCLSAANADPTILDASGLLSGCTSYAGSPSSVTGSGTYIDSKTVASGLTSGSTYYYQVKAVSSVGTSVSNIISFIPGSAVVTTDSVTAITTTGAVVWGSTKNSSNAAVTQALCVSTSSALDPSGSGALASCLKNGNNVNLTLASKSSTVIVDSYTVTGLNSGTQYWYQNQANDTTTPLMVYGPVNTFTTWGVVSYDGNGADNGAAQTQNGSATTTTLSPATTYVRTNYTLASWNTKSDGSGTSYSLGAGFNFKTNLSLFAIWTPNFTIVFNSQGGSSVANATYTGTAINTSTPTMTGYTFLGWFTSATGGNAIANPYSPAGPITLYAQWSKNTYSITFDASAGSFASGNPKQQTVSVSYGSDALASAPANPTLGGSFFKGWSDTSTSLTTLDSFTVGTSATTLYAIYGAVEIKYTVTFDTSTVDSGSPTSISVTQSGAGAAVNLSNVGSMIRNGWTLVGWTKSGSTTVYSLGSSYTPLSDLTMYPKWSPNYTVTFNNNLGSGSMSNQTGTGTTFDLTVNSFTRNGYTWDHWSDTSTANLGVSYQNTQTISLSSPLTLNLYAQWKAISFTYNFNVHYDGNGADAGSMNNESGNDSSFQLTKNAFTRSGYTFNGWSDTNTVGGTPYTDEQIVNLSGALTLTLYAKWTPKSYSVSYLLGSTGNPSGTLPGTISTYHPSDTFTVASSSGLSNTGYSFNGWSDGTNTFNPGDTSTISTTDVTLTATWAINSYTVTFNANGGTFKSNSSSTVTSSVNYGANALDISVVPITTSDTSSVNVPGATPIFNGWSESNGGAIVSASIVGAGPKTLWAVWSATAIKYTITYLKSSGETGTVPAAETNLDGAGDFAPADPTGTLSKTGYDFVDWTDVDGNKFAIDGTRYSVGFASDTLTAEWTPHHYDINFDGNGGTFSGATTTTASEHYGSLVTDNDPMPYWDGTHNFLGWNTDSTSATAVDTYTVGTTNPTYYAIWEVVSTYNYTITYNSNGADGGAYMSPQTGNAGSILLNANTYTYTGKTFTGWNTAANGSGTPYSNSGTIAISSATTLTLYAQWTSNAGGGGGNSLPAARLTWNNPANITYPTPLSGIQLNAVANVPGTYLYSPAAGTILQPGTYTLRVLFTPTSNSQYGPASATVTITVLSSAKTTPTIRWNTPSSITYPTPLSTAQLNAVCSVPGTLTYSPGLRAILQPGTYTLQVTCNPTSSNYSPVSAQVYLIVVKKAEVTQNNPTVELPKELPGGNSSIVITTPEAPGVGITEAQIVGGQLVTKHEPTFSGKTTVSVTVTNNGSEENILIPVIVPPDPPVAQSAPQTLKQATVSWEPSPNASNYEVVYRGAVVCETSSTTCAIPATIGPKTPVTVVAKGNDDTQNQVKPTLILEKPIPALTVNFDVASSALSAAAKAEIRSVAAIIKREGFTRLVVTGHTDIQTGVDNQALSLQRAVATKAYFEKVLPNVQFKIGAYADKKPVADSSTQQGLAANRRAQISVW